MSVWKSNKNQALMRIAVFLPICAFGGADYIAVIKQDVAIAFLVANVFAWKSITGQFSLPAKLLNERRSNIEILRNLSAGKKPVACVRLR